MMAASMALRKGLKCGTKAANVAGAVLTAGEVTAYVIRMRVDNHQLDSTTHVFDLKEFESLSPRPLRPAAADGKP